MTPWKQWIETRRAEAHAAGLGAQATLKSNGERNAVTIDRAYSAAFNKAFNASAKIGNPLKSKES